LVPRWAHGGGLENMIKRLNAGTPKLNQDILDEMENRGGPENITISGIKNYNKSIVGLNIKQVSELSNKRPLEVVKELLIATNGNVTAVYHSLDYEDVIRIMGDKTIAIASDGYAYSLDRKITLSNPHPRSFGNFQIVLQIVRERSHM